MSKTIEEFFRSVPINRFLGYTLERCDEDSAVISMPPRAEYLQEGQAVQGGIVSALADTTAAYALIPTLPPGMTMTGVEFKINFIRPAKLDHGLLRATGRALRRGRNLAVCEVRVAQADSDVAVALFTFLYLPFTKRQRHAEPAEPAAS